MTLNTFDKFIGWFSPKAELRRLQLRKAAEVLASYEGAKGGRRTAGWLSSGASANAEIGADLIRLRERSRSLHRDNPYAAHGRQVWRTAVVGYGVTARWQNQQTQAVWDTWQRRCSGDGLAHFAAVQGIACDATWESGEVLLRRRRRPASDGLYPSFQIQVMESDYLDLSKTGPADNGNYIIQGVEFTAYGKRVAYWLFGQHPGDVVATGVRAGLSLTSQRIPASEIIHHYRVNRPGQVRGVPRLAPVLLALRDLQDWEETELVRKKTEACLAAIVESPESDTGGNPVLGPITTDANGNAVESFEPGMIVRTRPGEVVKFNSPVYAGGYDEYKTSRVEDIAAGAEMPFCLMAGNYRKSNYSSSRMGLVDFGRGVASYQENEFIPSVCDGVAAWFAEELGLFGDGDATARPTWDAPAFDLLDREAEGRADQIELQLGGMTFPQYCGKRGYDPEKQAVELEQWAARLKAAGVDYFGGKLSAQTQNQPDPTQQQN